MSAMPAKALAGGMVIRCFLMLSLSSAGGNAARLVAMIKLKRSNTLLLLVNQKGEYSWKRYRARRGDLYRAFSWSKLSI